MSTRSADPVSLRVLALAVGTLMVASTSAAVLQGTNDDPDGRQLQTVATTTSTTQKGIERPPVTGGTEPPAPVSGVEASASTTAPRATGGSGTKTTSGSSATTAAPRPATTAAPRTTTTTRPAPSTTSATGPTATADAPGLYTVQPGGQGLTRLRDGSYSFLSWSPSGRTLAYGVPGASPARVEVVNADGSGRRALATGALVAPPAWSPDGKRLAVILMSGSSANLHLVGIDGSGLRAVTTRNDVSGVSWSRTGTIAFLSGGKVWTMTADGVGTALLADTDDAYRAIAWAPDAKRLAFANGTAVWFTTNEGGVARRLASTEGRTPDWSDLSWSPDSTRVAFQSGTGGAANVQVVGWDGTGLRTAATDAMRPQWAPNSAKLAIFTAGPPRGGGDRESHLELADADRTSFRARVVDDRPGAFQTGGPVWSADGGLLAFAIGGADRGGPPPPVPA